MLLARLLNKEQLGSWLLLIAGFALADAFRSAWVHDALMRLHTTASFTQQHRARAANAWRYFSLTAIGFGGWLLVWLLNLYFPAPNHYQLLINTFPLLWLLTTPAYFGTIAAVVQQQYNKMLLLRLVASLPLLLFAGWQLLHGPQLLFYQSLVYQQAVGVLLGGHAAASVMAIGMQWFPSIKSIFSARNKRFIRLSHRIGGQSLVVGTGQMLLKHSSPLLIGWGWGSIALAEFGVLFRLIEVAETVVRPVQVRLYALYSEWYNKKQNVTPWHQQPGILFLSFAILVLTAAAVFWPTTISVFLGGDDLHTADQLVKLLPLILLVLPLYQLMLTHKFAAKAYSAARWQSITAVVIQVLGLVLLALTKSALTWAVALIAIALFIALLVSSAVTSKK